MDIKANGAVQKGMPHKVYHGKTGVVYNVTKTSVGVIIYKKSVFLHRLHKRSERGAVLMSTEPILTMFVKQGQAPLHREACQPPCRARLPLPLSRGVRPPCQDQRRAQEEVKD